MEELTVKCRNPDCNKTVQNCKALEHETVCEYGLLSCVYSQACGKIPRKDLGKHHEVECLHRPVDCVLQCGVTLPLGQLEHHMSRECPNTMTDCPQNCSVILRRGEIEEHYKTECPYSLVSCSFAEDSGAVCGFKCMRIELTEHQLVCYLRLVKCQNQDCPSKVSYRSLSVHAEACLYKIVECSSSCGAKVTRGDLNRHKAEVCPQQQIDCPYSRLGCEAIFLRQDLMSHLKTEAQSHSLVTVKGIERHHKEIVTLQNEVSLLRMTFREEVRQVYLELSLLRVNRQRSDSMNEEYWNAVDQ
jgi:hypothetical protein